MSAVCGRVAGSGRFRGRAQPSGAPRRSTFHGLGWTRYPEGIPECAHPTRAHCPAGGLESRCCHKGSERLFVITSSECAVNTMQIDGPEPVTSSFQGHSASSTELRPRVALAVGLSGDPVVRGANDRGMAPSPLARDRPSASVSHGRPRGRGRPARHVPFHAS
jgi:hypothetical protein